MNYLEIVQETARLSGTVDSQSIETIEGATGRIGLIASLVQAAWTEIQNSHPAWRFLIEEFPEDGALITSGQTIYRASSTSAGGRAAGDLGLDNWSDWILSGAGSVPPTIWEATPAAGASLRGDEQGLVVFDYPAFRSSYQTGVSRETEGRPQAVTVDTHDRLVFWPTPTVDYRLSGTYRRAAQELSADDDTPRGIAEQYHRLLAWAGKLLLDHHDEADGNVLLADMNLPMTFQESMQSLRRRYLIGGGGLSIASRPIGGINPGGRGTTINITNVAPARSAAFFE